jgi:Histidine kinase-, DNA gyrase B-, and HSP90-like ATPase
MPRLFTKFTSKSHTETGLGLFVSKSIIEAHGGGIWAENNNDGKGATFTFRLPLAALLLFVDSSQFSAVSHRTRFNGNRLLLAPLVIISDFFLGEIIHSAKPISHEAINSII